MKIAIAIPIYNEKENILQLIKSLRRFSDQQHWPIDIVIVDDNSPDGSADAILSNYKNSSRIHLIKRPRKMGLGSAYINAFNFILRNLEPDIVIQMDADFSHPPELIPEMITKIESGNDLVIASRYVKNGGVENWTTSRKIISKGANLLFKLLLGSKINDVTSGFRAFRFETLKELMKVGLSSKGYEFQIEVINQISQITNKIYEVPFIFKDRKEGKSKLSMNDIIHFYLKVISLRVSRPSRSKSINTLETKKPNY